MTTARIELTTVGEDESRRRREQRGGLKALIVLGGLIALAFAGRETEPVLRLNSDATDFGSQVVGTRSSKPVGLRNATEAPFVVAGIVAEGAVIQDFSVDLTRCGSIAPGAECVATVSFAPHDPGPQSAKFRVVDASNASSETIVVRGAGTVLQTPEPVVVPPVVPSEPVVVPPVVVPPVAPVVAPPPVIAPPVPKPVTPPVQPAPPPVQPAPPAPQPTVPDIVIPQPEEEPKPTEPAPEVTQPAPPETPKPTPPKEPSKTKSFFKKLGAFAVPVIIGAVIANNQPHGNHVQTGEQKSEQKAIDVSPRDLTFRNPNGSAVAGAMMVTVTSTGKDTVTIRSVRFSGNSGAFDQNYDGCTGRSLKPTGTCQVAVTWDQQHTGANAKLVVDSDGGQATVSVNSPPNPNYKP